MILTLMNYWLPNRRSFPDQDGPARGPILFDDPGDCGSKAAGCDRSPVLFDLLVLAGFMRNLSPYFIDRVNAARHRLPRIMNIHPALLPAFPGMLTDTEIHFRYGCKVGGCTVHFIDYGEDTGPIIGQRAFPDRAGMIPSS